MTLRDQIKRDISEGVDRLVGKWDGRVEVMRTANAKFGDYSTNVALRLAALAQGKMLDSKTKQTTVKSANILSDSLKDLPYVEKLEVAGPGFINFFIKPEVWQKEISGVLESAAKYGSNQLGKGKKARVEFVSANPTGPLHFGNARGGPIGDVLCNVLEFCGWQVLREYIDNDRGNQVYELGRTLAAKAGLIKAGEEPLIYKGGYTQELARQIKKQIGDIGDLSQDQVISKTGEEAVKILHKEIIGDCRDMGINFDLIVHESELQKRAPRELELLERKGFLKKYEGAVWFAPKNEYLQDKDAVVVKSDGSYTYFTADVVYHLEKFESGYDLVVDIFGSNTVGHVPKLKALARAVGFDLAKFIVILYQFVRVKRGNEIVRMSKRAGTFVTAREVLDEVGRDALRFFILMHDPNTHMDFDLELAKKKSADNPVYYVQYAHARICSILSKAKGARGGSLSQGRGASLSVSYKLLTTNYELDLIKQITRLPELVEDIASSFAVQRLTSYAIDLADSFHRFYENCKVIPPFAEASEGKGEKGDLMRARIGLILATKIALANTLGLLGISAPEKM